MLNLHEAVRTNPRFNKLQVGDLLFAEYTCPVGAAKLEHWAHLDYLVHVISGKKIWHTLDGAWHANPGETLYFKKGGSIIEQFFDVDFCLLMFFIPDDLIRTTVRELATSHGRRPRNALATKSTIRVENDVGLDAFFQSMRTYFAAREKPSEPLLRLKLKELIVSILTSNRNPALMAYFHELSASDAPSVKAIMEINFRFHLSLEEFARLCHRSLSSFKRDFQAHFNESPGKWLLAKRLDHSAALFRSSKLNVTQAAYESGFEDVSHFSRAFKQKFGVSPAAYRKTA